MTAERKNLIQVPKQIIDIRVEKETLLPYLEEKLLSIQKDAVVDGFRKGSVPISILKAKHQNMVLMELARNEVQKEIDSYIFANKLQLIVHPGVVGFKKINKDGFDGYEAKVLFFTSPELTLDMTLPFSVIESKPITEENINGYIEMNRHRSGTVDNTESNVSVKTDMLYVEIKEIDKTTRLFKIDGFKIETIIDISKLNNSLAFLGKTKNDTVLASIGDITKNIAEMYKILKLNPETDTVSINTPIHVRILSVNRPVPAEVNEDFFKKCFPLFDIATEDEFRKIVSIALADNADINKKRVCVQEHITKLAFQVHDVDLSEILDYITSSHQVQLNELSSIAGDIRATIVMYSVNSLVGDVTEEDAKNHLTSQIHSLIGENEKSAEIIDKLTKNKNNINKAADNILNNRIFEMFSKSAVIEHVGQE